MKNKDVGTAWIRKYYMNIIYTCNIHAEDKYTMWYGKQTRKIQKKIRIQIHCEYNINKTIMCMLAINIQCLGYIKYFLIV